MSLHMIIWWRCTHQRRRAANMGVGLFVVCRAFFQALVKLSMGSVWSQTADTQAARGSRNSRCPGLKAVSVHLAKTERDMIFPPALAAIRLTCLSVARVMPQIAVPCATAGTPPVLYTCVPAFVPSRMNRPSLPRTDCTRSACRVRCSGPPS